MLSIFVMNNQYICRQEDGAGPLWNVHDRTIILTRRQTESIASAGSVVSILGDLSAPLQTGGEPISDVGLTCHRGQAPPC